MTNVIKFPKHKLHRCRTDGGVIEECIGCRGGLSSCVTCGGAEASLPTHCPGEHMDAFRCDSVQSGAADYKNGEWQWYGMKAKEVFDA